MWIESRSDRDRILRGQSSNTRAHEWHLTPWRRGASSSWPSPRCACRQRTSTAPRPPCAFAWRPGTTQPPPAAALLLPTPLCHAAGIVQRLTDGRDQHRAEVKWRRRLTLAYRLDLRVALPVGRIGAEPRGRELRPVVGEGHRRSEWCR